MNAPSRWITPLALLVGLVGCGHASAQYYYPFGQVPHHHAGIGYGYFADPLVNCGLYDQYVCPGPIVMSQVPIISMPVFVQPVPVVAAIQPAPRVPFVPAANLGGIDALGQAVRQRPANLPVNDEIRRRADALKTSTPAGRSRADLSIARGDESFAKGVYARSTARYREAIARAPDYAEGHFRLAHAYVATSRFNLALKSALTALELSGSNRRDGFSLAEMYRGNQFARQQHDAKLLDAAQREPDDGGLQFLIGLTLHYGGNPLQAREHFHSAARLPGAQQAYVRLFLPVAPIVEPKNQLVEANAEVQELAAD